MGIEIERKFLVSDDSWKIEASQGMPCRQGYLVTDPEKTVRVRVLGDRAFLTVKGATTGLSRPEYEYEIPLGDAEGLLQLCGSRLEKTRYVVECRGLTWEVDVFEGANAGLVMAEVELVSEEQEIVLPAWAGKEVSCDERYYNGYLSRHPFKYWNGAA
jgi:adenylate cyclase